MSRVPVTLHWTDATGSHSHSLQSGATIGSAPGADIHIEDRAVSRLHAELTVRDDGVWLRDVGSKNGTLIDGVRVIEARVANDGRVRVGSTTIQLRAEEAPQDVELWPRGSYGRMIGTSVVMRELFARLARVAALESTVLVQGETGTGKELVAQALHEHSPRAKGPFVVVDCGALPENLLEAELFGHAKGAFTGAATARAGAVESADGGTVFLDEIGEMPIAMQPKLLRVLESRTVRRLGETAHRKVDVRFVSATHRNLREMINAKAFREDLYFRLAVVPIALPSLRERREDIPALVAGFLPAGQRTVFDDAQLVELTRRPWLGNVRELRNFVERSIALGARAALAMDAASSQPAMQASATSGMPPVPLDRAFKDIRDQWNDYLEREYLRGMLERHGRNITVIADAAGLDRTYIHRLIRRHGL